MTTPSASPNSGQVPTGRDEVRAAIRDVAAHARVNHGLVFRHFGSKEQLVGAVLNHLAAQMAALIDTDASLAEIAAAGTRQLHVIARALLDGYPVAQLQSSFPAADRLLNDIRPLHDNEDDARLATAHAVALLLGWQMFEPFVRSAVGLHNIPPDRVRQSMFAEMARISEPH